MKAPPNNFCSPRIAFLLELTCVCANDQSVNSSAGKKLEEFEPNTEAPIPVVLFLECIYGGANLLSLVPRPSHHPVFDHKLQAIKNWTVGRPGNEAKPAHKK